MKEKSKKISVFLPNSARFTNKLVNKKLAQPSHQTISFQQTPSPRCHNLIFRREKQKKRYQDFYDFLHIRTRSSQEKGSYLKTKTCEKRQTSKGISFSRMIQDSSHNEDFKFSYISQFYKKSIEKQLALKKSSNKNKIQFSQILNVFNYNPQQSNLVVKRSIKSGCNTCRCSNRISAQARNISSTLTHRQTRVSPQTKSLSFQVNEKKYENNNEEAIIKHRRKVIKLRTPQNWNIESWKTTSMKHQSDENERGQNLQND